MLKNYVTVAFRNLFKNKLFTAINITGMAISFASFLIIGVFLYDELQFDKHVADHELKYRLFNEYHSDNGTRRMVSMVPPAFTEAVANEFEEIEYFVRILYLHNEILFEAENKKITEREGGYADPQIFKMFSLELTEGDANSAISAPNTIAISKSLADKYFGNKSALGQTLEVGDAPLTVNAVFQDFPVHSHLRLNFFISMETLRQEIPERMQSWRWSQFHTYVKVKPLTEAAVLEGKLRKLAEMKAWPITKPDGGWYIPHLLALKDIHLHASDHVWDIAVRGNAQTAYVLAATALFILLIAILNFVNLSTARAINRVKEVGVRKVVGAFRSQLIYQFISESVMIAFIALVIGGVITELAIPYLNAFTEKHISSGVFLNPLAIFSVLALGLTVGIAAGAYPALYISGFTPGHILAGKRASSSGKLLLRKSLVSLQFILSFLLIIASFVVSEQHRFMRTKDMGFNKENLITLQLRGEMQRNFETVKNEFAKHPSVVSASMGYGLPGEAYAGDGILDKETDKRWNISMLTVDHDYIKTLGLQLIAGRDFSKDIPSDEHEAFILSESAVKMLGIPNSEEALGHEIAWDRWDAPDSLKEGKVIGVIKDVHLNSLRESISPIIVHVYPYAYSSITLKVTGENLPETIEHLKSTWKKFNSEWPFEYRFVDDNFDKMYKAEEKLATLFTAFTGFTIIVACMGLFGLVVYNTTQQYKEISIRKVLGADESTLVFGLSKSYIVLIVIAFFVAIPLGYFGAVKWLEGFAYHIDITPMIFIKAALLISALTIITVGIQSLKAARTNPVNALKEQ